MHEYLQIGSMSRITTQKTTNRWANAGKCMVGGVGNPAWALQSSTHQPQGLAPARKKYDLIKCHIYWVGVNTKFTL